MSRWKPRKGDKLVGKRIDPKTPLGETLAKLRTQYAMAAQITTPQEDLQRRMMETSMNVEAPLNDLAAKKERDQRARLIRERIQRAMDATYTQHGQYPTTIGVPAEVYDETKEACAGYIDVIITTEKVSG